ncbi:glycosyltransferase family 29 protein [Candidatus Pelagibacter bacterium nBUS_32]|uniref:glycosyltransferase family 29 protein n=1 Tax=Candidatus Pelagibacter bacterium nBUS_32 TaxID=3374192 RepID=UPI003EC0E812
MFENYKIILSNYIYKKKIAVIFSSKNIFSKKYGKIIDGHDHVIRLNDQKITNYKKFVGSKTTIRFVNTSILLKYLKRIKKSHIRENVVFISPHYISQLKKKIIKKSLDKKSFFLIIRIFIII